MNRKLKLDELKRPTIEEYRDVDKHSVWVVLDDVRSLSNVGSVFRTCDAFAVEKLFLCGITGKPPHREIQKTALGATESVTWEYLENIQDVIHLAKQVGFKVIAIEQCMQSVPPRMAFSEVEKVCLILGNEVEGVSQSIIDVSDTVVEIPQQGTKHSLNVAVAAGIIVWEAIKGR